MSDTARCLRSRQPFGATFSAWRRERDRPGDGRVGRGREGEHRKLAVAANIVGLLRETGWIKVWRSPRGEDAVRAEAEALKPYGVAPRLLDRNALVALEPTVGELALGGAHFVDSLRRRTRRR